MDKSNKRGHDHCVIFLHIPKTAGTTFAKILQRRYPAAALEWLGSEGDLTADQLLAALSPERKAEVTALLGHVNFGAHRLLPRPARYVTFVRHPVDRIVSHYYHVLRHPHHYLHEQVTSRRMSLADYAASGLSNELQNGQTRLIAGPGDFASEQQMLEAAYLNIESHFSCVGVTERFAESILLTSHMCGWSVPYYRDANIGGNKAWRSEISADAIAIIESQNPCDLELYRFANRRLDRQLAAHLPNWESQTKRLLWRNRQYTRLAHAGGLLRRSVRAGSRLLKSVPSISSNSHSQSTMNTSL